MPTILQRVSTGLWGIKETRPVGSSVTQFAPPLTRGTFAAWRAARSAVRARVHLTDYLRSRRAEYLARSPNSLVPLRNDVDERMVPADTSAATVDVYPDESTFAAVSARRGHPTFRTYTNEDSRRRLALIAEQRSTTAARLSDVATRLRVAGARVEQLKIEQDAEIAAGQSSIPAIERRGVTRRGRPLLPFPWGRAAYAVGTSSCLIAEAYQFALPYFDVTGIDSTNLPVEWVRNPLAVLTGAGFALAASGVLFLFADQAVQSGIDLFRGHYRGARALVMMLWILTLVALVCYIAHGIGAMRHVFGDNATGVASAGRGQLFFLLTTMLPFGVAFSHQRVHSTGTARESIRTAQRDWDAQEELLRRTRNIRDERLRSAVADKTTLEADERACQEAIDRLDQEAQGIQKQASTDLMTEELALREQLGADRRYLMAFLNAAEAALEKDRFHFIKQASKRHRELLTNEETDAAALPVEAGGNLIDANSAVTVGNTTANGNGRARRLFQSSPALVSQNAGVQGGWS